jgi:hypothetical protein
MQTCIILTWTDEDERNFQREIAQAEFEHGRACWLRQHDVITRKSFDTRQNQPMELI